MSQTRHGGVLAPAVEIRSVTKEFPGHPPVVALDDVNLTVERGELVAIVGPSGSGKSTLLTIMGTLDRPTSGTVMINGIDTSRLNDRRLAGLRANHIGFVFQQFFLIDGLDAIANVENGLLYSGLAPSRRRKMAIAALERVGLGHRLHHQPSHLSGGERQRVAVARAIVHEPAFVLADEPTGNLDSRSSATVVELLRDLHESGTSIVVITHDQAIADGFPRQVHVLDGHLIVTEQPAPTSRVTEPTP